MSPSNQVTAIFYPSAMNLKVFRALDDKITIILPALPMAPLRREIMGALRFQARTNHPALKPASAGIDPRTRNQLQWYRITTRGGKAMGAPAE